MLSKDPKKRPSAEQVLSSPWFNRTMKGSGEPAEIGDQIINNLKNFHVCLDLLSSKTSLRQ